MKSPFAGALSELGSLFDNVGRLARLDFLLLTAELRDSRRSLLVAISMIATAFAISFFAIGLLVTSIVLLLIEHGLRPSVASLAIAIIILVMAASLALVASAKMKSWSIVPRRTLRQVSENLDALRTSLSDDKPTQS